MTIGDKQSARSRQLPAADILVIGGGIMGLWATHFAAEAGTRVLLVDAEELGRGASGGLLGALMPHMPDKWNQKKQFQFDALVSLEDEVAALEAKTGLSAGYRRSGRLIPLPKPHLREIALRHSRDAETNWQAGERQFQWHVREPDFAGALLEAEFAAAGLVEDTLAARVSPRGLGDVLKAALKAHPAVTILEHSFVARLDGSQAELGNGQTITFGQAIIANGWQSKSLIESLVGPMPKPVILPVKGQSALLKAEIDPGLPVIFLDGLYIVPHEGGRVAIGSTSENRFGAPFTTDSQLDDLISEAIRVMPSLSRAPVLERWAGLRPKAIGRDPMVGRLPGYDTVSVLTGGFKISFGVAHRLASALVAAIVANRPETGLPESFSPVSHLKEAGFAS